MQLCAGCSTAAATCQHTPGTPARLQHQLALARLAWRLQPRPCMPRHAAHYSQHTTASTLQPAHYSQHTTASTLQPAYCIQHTTASTLQPAHYSQHTTASTLHPAHGTTLAAAHPTEGWEELHQPFSPYSVSHDTWPQLSFLPSRSCVSGQGSREGSGHRCCWRGTAGQQGGVRAQVLLAGHCRAANACALPVA